MYEIKSHKKRILILKKLEEKILHEQKKRKIIRMSLELNFSVRGDQEHLNIDYITHELYRYRGKNELIYTTSTLIYFLGIIYALILAVASLKTRSVGLASNHLDISIKTIKLGVPCEVVLVSDSEKIVTKNRLL